LLPPFCGKDYRPNKWVKGETIINRREGDFVEGCGASHPCLCNVGFQLPIGVCKRMKCAIAQLWWSDDENSKKMHWFA
jgi:hypothetical protein